MISRGEPGSRTWTAVLARGEDLLGVAALAAMALLPALEVLGRRLFGVGVPGGGVLVQHLTLWIAFLGAALASREGRLLSLSAGASLLPSNLQAVARVLTAGVGAAVATLLAWASLNLVLAERAGGKPLVTGLPLWVAETIMPIGFAAVALRLAWRAGPTWPSRALAGFGLLAGGLLALAPEALARFPAWPGLLLLLVATLLGAPIFVALGGAALLLFLRAGVPIAAVPVETYRLVASPTLPTIPLFTLAGYLLAESGAPSRLIRLFRALFGWVPGGTAVVTALLCAFFTTFTGGSGVTILALGGLLLPALLEDRYPERFSLGLLTASGSLGLLFPPCLPVILFGVVAATPIDRLYLGGLVPGLLLVALVAGWGVSQALRSGAGRVPFAWREAAAAVWAVKWELGLPVLVLLGLFGGLATLVETAAAAALYALLVEGGIHRDLRLRGDALRVMVECVTLVGGVLIILGVALGFTSYLVDAGVPALGAAWVREVIHSRWLFLLALNLFLLVVGCLMDIFSAIVVVVPLIAPMGEAFGVDPVHLGIIFLANLELGYLTPPVGMNLFLASYRFGRPLSEICRAVGPPLLLLGAGVLLITYFPALSTALPALLGR
ncbi:MAG: TRAP transporter large permease subunit [Candidatus Methylomirabilales bacterium]